MESKTKVFGHPLHPILIVIPLGLFISAVICDIIYLINHVQFYPVVSYYNIAGGIIGGLLAAIFGFRDWLAIPSGTRAKRIGGWHGLGNVVLVALFLLSWLIRGGDPSFLPSTLALILSFAAIILGTLTAWLGGELVYRLDVAVDRDANLDAPSSLSGQPAGLRGSMVPVTGKDRDKDPKNLA
jgi:uncharacterized membrane protein